MTDPPKYPRIPHIAPSPAATADDIVLAPSARDAFVGEVVVEEKLDGMNVTIWVDRGVPLVATRGGADTSDRSGERGRLRAWAAVHADRLVTVLGERYALYAEWLRRRHGVAYDRLPAELVGLDVFDRSAERFLDVDERDRLLAALGVPAPPRRFRGRIESISQLRALFGPSAFAHDHAEGLIVRAVDSSGREISKLVDPVWRGIGSAPWRGENRLAS